MLGKRRERYVAEVKEVLPTIAFELAFLKMKEATHLHSSGQHHETNSCPPLPDGGLLFYTPWALQSQGRCRVNRK